MKIYKSKISYGFLGAIFILFGTLSYFSITNNHSSLKSIILVNLIHVIVFLFLLYIFYSIRYTIQNSILKIECGFIFKKKINIDDISSVSKTSSLLSSPAASITDRIVLKFGTYDSIIISPKKKMEFVDDLLKVNSNIKNNL